MNKAECLLRLGKKKLKKRERGVVYLQGGVRKEGKRDRNQSAGGVGEKKALTTKTLG